MSTPPAPASNPNTAAAGLPGAERRRATLERLTEIGMELAEEIRERTVQACLHPEPRHDPCRGFAAVSRAVRLTVMLEAKMEAQVVAPRNRLPPVLTSWTLDSVPAARDLVDAEAAPQASGVEDADRADPTETTRESLDREVGDGDEMPASPRSIRQRLIEGENLQDILDGDVDACIDTIRAELGLHPLPTVLGEGPLRGAEPGGEVGDCANVGGDPESPTPDFASLRLDPPHKGEGGRETEPIFESAG